MLPYILLCCTVSVSTAQPAEDLIVGPGDRIALQPEEPGAEVEAAIDGGPLRPVDGMLEVPAEGDHWLAVASRDRVGNLSPVRWIRLRVDDQPPVVELLTEPLPVVVVGKSWVPPGSRAVARAVDAQAGLASLRLQIGDQRQEASQAELVGELPPAGEVRLRAWASDRVDNSSAAVELEVTVDGVAPAAEIRLVGPAVEVDEGWIAGPEARLAATVSDAHSGVDRWTPRLGGEEVDPQRWQGPWPAGSYLADLEAVDRVGNRALVGGLPFRVDDAGPVIAWQVLDDGVEVGGEFFYRGPVRVQVAATDDLAGVASLEWILPAGGAQPVRGLIVTDAEQMQLRAVDRVGNSSLIEVGWHIDTDGPELSIRDPEGQAVASGGRLEIRLDQQLKLDASDAGSGVAEVIYRYGLVGPRRSLPQQLEFRHPGRFWLRLTAVDRLGNISRGDWTVVVRRAQAGGGKR